MNYLPPDGNMVQSHTGRRLTAADHHVLSRTSLTGTHGTWHDTILIRLPCSVISPQLPSEALSKMPVLA